MKNTRVLIQLPPVLKQWLNELRTQGYTASGYIRALLERDFETNGSTPQTKEVRRTNPLRRRVYGTSRTERSRAVHPTRQ
jgi:hypothetical protein